MRAAFEEYVPIPITPEITFAEVPDTCEGEAIAARARLAQFISDLSIELTFQDWLSGELKEGCESLVHDLNMGIDFNRVPNLEQDKIDLIVDLWELEGGDASLSDYSISLY